MQLCFKPYQYELGHLVAFKKPQGGMALWLTFNENYQLADIINKVRTLGLQLVGMPYFKGSDLTHDAIRFGFASLNEQELAFAVDVLKKITFAK